MKKYILITIALFLLLVDVRIGILPYPEFEEFVTEAPVNVDMVIRHVIGERMMIDIASDALGFILMIIAAFIFIKSIKKDNNIAPARAKQCLKSMNTTIVWSVIGLATYVCEKIMPYYNNGNLRYRFEYLLYFLLAIAELVVYASAFLTVCRLQETLENHTYNNLSTIFAMLSIATLIVAKILYFYELTIVFVIYYFVSIFFFALAMYRLRKYR